MIHIFEDFLTSKYLIKYKMQNSLKYIIFDKKDY